MIWIFAALLIPGIVVGFACGFACGFARGWREDRDARRPDNE